MSLEGISDHFRATSRPSVTTRHERRFGLTSVDSLNRLLAKNQPAPSSLAELEAIWFAQNILGRGSSDGFGSVSSRLRNNSPGISG